MTLPEGRLLRSRVVEDPATALAGILDRELTGYAVLEPQDTLLLDADDAGVIRFRAGVAVAAYHGGTDRGGPAALGDLAVPGPYSVELYAVDRPSTAVASERRIPPGMAAERLAGDPELADRVRKAARERGPSTASEAPGSDPGASPDPGQSDPAGESGASEGSHDPAPEPADAVRAFLDDEEKVAALKQQARKQARDRAAEWGIEDQLTDAG
jgi:hypothetical protein